MGWGGVHSVGMEQGVFAAIASFGPFTAAYFMAYEWMKTQASNLLGYDRDSLPLALNLGPLCVCVCVCVCVCGCVDVCGCVHVCGFDGDSF